MKQTIRTFIAKIPLAKPLYCSALMTNYLKRLFFKQLQWKRSTDGNQVLFHYFEKAYGATSLVRIQSGNSKDRKYEMHTKDGEHCFLKISSVDRKSLFEFIYAVQTELFRTGCLPNEPMGVGTCPGGSYLLDSWVSGDTLLRLLSAMGREEQYEKGRQVGLQILRLHEASMNQESVPPLSDMFKRVLNRFKKTEHDLFGFRQEMICEIEKTIRNMDNRPTVLLHGDFHLNNIILDEKETPVIIDLETLCVGDPLWDIVSIMDSCRLSHPFRWFNQGIVSAYTGDYSESEWEIMASYYCFRRVNEYQEFYGHLTDRLSSPFVWEMYCSFLRHPLELKKWLLG